MLLRPFLSKRPFQIVFVVSSPRSGSTWLKQALNAHPQIHCTENRLFGPHYDTVFDGPQKHPRLRITLDAYVDALLKSISVDHLKLKHEKLRQHLTRELSQTLLNNEHQLSGCPIIVDKCTPYVGTAEAVVQNLAVTFPDAKFVHLTRDGRDVVTSGVFHWLNKSKSPSESLFESRRRSLFAETTDHLSLDRFFTDDELIEWAKTWAEPNRAMWKLTRNTRVLHLRYEDMLTHHEEELSRLLRFIGLPVHSKRVRRCVEQSTFEKMSGGRRRGEADALAHVRKGIAGDWKQYFTRNDGQLFDEHAGSELQQLGYESDSEWLANLPEKVQIRKKSAA